MVHSPAFSVAGCHVCAVRIFSVFSPVVKSRSPTELHYNLDSNRAQRDLVAQLEAKNREIMREIQRLRLEQEAFANETESGATYNPTLLAELRLLRQRKDELETRMSALQESRKDLMVQLESLMKLLKSPISPVEPASPSFIGSPLNEFVQVTNDQLQDIILKSNKTSPDADPIPTKLVLEILDILLPVTAKIINISLATGKVWAICFKRAVVNPSSRRLGSIHQH
ncbi:hypothetical protein BaRGS_00007566, partial [Batillaria attramentaria]